MPKLISIPEKVRARDLFDKLAPEVEEMRKHVESRARVLDSLQKLLHEIKEDEQSIEGSRQVAYALLIEKLRTSEAEAGDEISFYVASTLEALTTDKVKPKGSP